MLEAPLGSVADAGVRDGEGKVAFAGAGPTDQHDVALLGQERPGGQVPDQRLIDRRVDVQAAAWQHRAGSGSNGPLVDATLWHRPTAAIVLGRKVIKVVALKIKVIRNAA